LRSENIFSRKKAINGEEASFGDRKGIQAIFRDGITIYLSISPALLALVFILVLAACKNPTFALAAVKGNLPQALTAGWKPCRPRVRGRPESLKNRVNGADSLAGVYCRTRRPIAG
jgi:hypothetical protein